jgi:hypothetical protein
MPTIFRSCTSLLFPNKSKELPWREMGKICLLTLTFMSFQLQIEGYHVKNSQRHCSRIWNCPWELF